MSLRRKVPVDRNSPTRKPSTQGRPLDPGPRALMGAKFGRDFSDVRVHTGEEAAASAQSLQAKAYTFGQDIVFNEGRYAPDQPEGMRLLAHELAHTVQQQGGGTSTEGQGEAEATRASESVTSGGAVPALTPSGVGVQRDPLPSADLSENASPFLAASLASTVVDRFATGSAELTPEHKAKLRDTAAMILKMLKQYPQSTVRSIGHTDTVGTEANNLILGQSRADAVRDELVKDGVPMERILTESAGEGGSQAVKTKDETPNASNRRVEVRFRPEKLSVPSILPPLSSDAPKKDPLPKPEPFDPFKLPQKSPGGPLRPEAPSLPPDFWKPLPPPIPGTGPKSALDILNSKIVDPIVDSVTKGLGLPKSVQEAARDAAHAGVAKGISAGVEAALDSAGVKDPQAKQAILKAVEAAIREKGGQGSNP